MIDDTLNEFQKRRIAERLNLNFEDELLKSNSVFERKRFSKNFRNYLDIFINELYNNGILFYSFDIVMPFSKNQDPSLWYYTHLRVEDIINYLKEKIELIEFCYLSIELHKTYFTNLKKNEVIVTQNTTMIGLPFFKAIIGVRSLVGTNEFH